MRTIVGRTLLPIFLAVLSALSPEAAAAQADEQQARTHFATGQSLVAEHRWIEAYTEFEAGYALSHRPLFLFNMAECARESGRTSQARIDYARYLEADPSGAQSETARERLALLGPEPAVEVHTTENVPSPEEAAEQSVNDAIARSIEPHDGPELWEDWPFWTIVGGAVVLAAVGTTVGIVVSESNGGALVCGDGCSRIEW